jgi:hypothetical protein
MDSCSDDIPLSVSLAVQCSREVLQLMFVGRQEDQCNFVTSESRLHLDFYNVAPLLKSEFVPLRVTVLVLAPCVNVVGRREERYNYPNRPGCTTSVQAPFSDESSSRIVLSMYATEKVFY